MSITIDQAIARLEQIAQPDALDAVKRDVADAGLALVNQTFMTSTDPYGFPYAPLKRPGGVRAGGPLRKTDTMRQSAAGEPTTSGVRYTVDGPANFHQDGTRYIPTRRMLPVANLGLPRGWTVMIGDSFARRMRERLVGG